MFNDRDDERLERIQRGLEKIMDLPAQHAEQLRLHERLTGRISEGLDRVAKMQIPQQEMIGKIADVQHGQQRLIDKIVDAMEHLVNTVDHLSELQRRNDERLAEFALAATQASREIDLKVGEVADKLNALIDIVDGMVRRPSPADTAE